MLLSAARLVKQATAQGITLATAESCTGGLVAAAITDVPGSSAAFLAGYVTYSNAAKQAALGVPATLLAQYGAVSEPVAAAMATGARAASGALVAVSTTGIAGPGGSEFKPEGRVCYAIATPAGVESETIDHGPLGRDAVRAAARDHALALLLRAVGA